MKLDWTLNAGDVLIAVGLFVGFITAHVQNVRRLQNIETRVDLIYLWFRRRVLNMSGSDED